MTAHDEALADYKAAILHGLWAGTKLTIKGLLVGTLGGALFGWHLGSTVGGTVDSIAHALVFSLVGILVTLGFLSTLATLQTVLAIARTSVVVGVPLALVYLIGTTLLVAWLSRVGFFAYLIQAPAIVVGIVGGFCMVAYAAVTFIATAISTGFLVAEDWKKRNPLNE